MGQKNRNRVSPREWVMTSDTKYVVSQFWNLSEFRLNSGVEPALGLVLSREGYSMAAGLAESSISPFCEHARNKPAGRDPWTRNMAA